MWGFVGQKSRNVCGEIHIASIIVRERERERGRGPGGGVVEGEREGTKFTQTTRIPRTILQMVTYI